MGHIFPTGMKKISAAALYRAEKERVARERTSTHTRLLAEAKAAFEKLIAEGQAARKGGRPKGSITLGSSKRLPPPNLDADDEPIRRPVPVKKAAVEPAKTKVAPPPGAKQAAKPAAKPAKKKVVVKAKKPAKKKAAAKKAPPRKATAQKKPAKKKR